jgi:hypothetical protein
LLVEQLAEIDADVAKAVKEAWQLPGRSLAFRNAEHKKAITGPTTPGPRSKISE